MNYGQGQVSATYSSLGAMASDYRRECSDCPGLWVEFLDSETGDWCAIRPKGKAA